MKRASVVAGWTAGLWMVVVGSGGTAAAQAHTTEASHIPRSLRAGAPTQRLPASLKQRRAASTPRPAPLPSIRLDARNPLSPRGAHRSEALLVREIALLERLTKRTERQDPHRADALLRLAYALQELMWIQEQHLHQLQVEDGGSCSCVATTTSEPNALACATAPDAGRTRDQL
jgi:hypothetical protein